MQNSYRLITTKILQRLHPKSKSSSSRVILAFYSSQSPKNLPDPDKCNDKEETGTDVLIDGKIAIITGGAQGIGFNLAQTLLRNGIRGVTLADNDCQNGEKSCLCLCEEFGDGRAMFCDCDVMKSENMDGVFKRTLKHFNRIDYVINNAGILNDKKWETEITVNIGGCVIGSLLGLQYMSKSCHGKGGVVVNLANTAGIQPLCGCPIYTMTQSAIVGFTRALGSGSQYQRTGVKIMALCAGPTNTQMMKELKSRALNEHFANELVEELEGNPLQEKSFVSEGILKMLSEGGSGSIWVAHNSEEAFQISFQAMESAKQDQTNIKRECADLIVEKDQTNNLLTNKITERELLKDKKIIKNVSESGNKLPQQELVYDQKSIHMDELDPAKHNVLPQSQSTTQEWMKFLPISSLQNIQPTVQPSLGIPLTPSFNSAQSFDSKNKRFEPSISTKSKDHKSSTAKSKDKKASNTEQNTSTTSELCEVLKNIISKTTKKVKEVQNTRNEKIDEESGSKIGPKVLNSCKPMKGETSRKPDSSCEDIRSNQKQIDDICAKLKNSKRKKNPSKETSKTTEKKDMVLKDSKKTTDEKKKDSGPDSKKEGRKPNRPVYDGRKGACIIPKREIDETPVTIHYHGKPIDPFLPPDLSRNTHNEWKKCKRLAAEIKLKLAQEEEKTNPSKSKDSDPPKEELM